jgi:hypothetical protein
MTDLTKPIRRIARNAVSTHGLSADLVVTLYPGGILGLREPRRRQEWTIPLEAVLTLAIQRDADAQRAAKRITRKR